LLFTPLSQDDVTTLIKKQLLKSESSKLHALVLSFRLVMSEKVMTLFPTPPLSQDEVTMYDGALAGQRNVL
jgi:hypothetical protein